MGRRQSKESSRGTQLEDILSSENLSRAWKQVRGNKGAAGVDGMEVGDFPAFYAKHWEMIRRKLEESWCAAARERASASWRASRVT